MEKKKKKKIYVAPQLRESPPPSSSLSVQHISPRTAVFAGCSNTSTTAIFTWLLMHSRNIGDTLIQGEWEIYQPDHIIFAHPSPRHGVPCPMYSRPLAVFFFSNVVPTCVRAGLSPDVIYDGADSRDVCSTQTSTLKTFRHSRPSIVICQVK